MIDQKLLKKIIADRPHKDVLCKSAQEALAAFNAGDALGTYVPKLSKLEDPADYSDRQQHAIKNYKNYPDEIANKYFEGVFRKEWPTRKTGVAAVDAYLDSPEYKTWWKKDAALYSLLLPEMFIGVALPVKPDENEVDTLADRQALGVPKPYEVYPHHVVNFEVGDDGQLNWIVIKHTDKTYRVFDRTDYCEVTPNGRIVEAWDKHGFSRVPFIRIAWKENTSYNCTPSIGRAMMSSIVSLALACLDYTALLHQACKAGLFLKLIAGEETTKNIQNGGLGNTTIIKEGDEEKGSTRYLETPSYEIDKLADIVYTKTPTEVYRVARLRESQTSVVGPTSGISKAFDMVPETDVLAEIAEFWKAIEILIAFLIADGFTDNYKIENVKLTYPTTFDLKSPAEVIAEAQAVCGLIKLGMPGSITAAKELMKKIYRLMLEDAPKDILDKVIAEIEAFSADQVIGAVKAIAEIAPPMTAKPNEEEVSLSTETVD